jgi:hypothetical protein
MTSPRLFATTPSPRRRGAIELGRLALEQPAIDSTGAVGKRSMRALLVAKRERDRVIQPVPV